MKVAESGVYHFLSPIVSGGIRTLNLGVMGCVFCHNATGGTAGNVEIVNSQ